MNSDDLLTAAAAIATITLLLMAVQKLPANLTRSLLPPENGAILQPRVAAIDGLRAFLALGVVFWHAWMVHSAHFFGRSFEPPHNPYFHESGLMAVPIFFMITGFLFWNKAIILRGRVNPFRLYRNRARRILPLYYFLCFCALVVAVARSRGTFNEPVGVQVGEIAGLIVPGLRTTGPLLGTERMYMMAQSWTLLYEDFFYLALPIFGIAARSRRSALILVMAVLILVMIRRIELHGYDYFLLSFLVGIGTAEFLVRAPNASTLLSSKPLGLGILALPLLLPWLTGGEVTPLAFACAAVSFTAIAAGNDLSGLLTLRCARIVGTISYSIYLLHMIILYCGLTVLNRLIPLGLMAPLDYSAVVCIAVLIVGALSMLSSRFIERPWIHR